MKNESYIKFCKKIKTYFMTSIMKCVKTISTGGKDVEHAMWCSGCCRLQKAVYPKQDCV